MKQTDNDPNYSNFHNFDELTRLRYTIARFKEYDRKRNLYVHNLEKACENYRGKIKEYEKLTERQHNEIDELMNAYETAKPLIDNPGQKAYVHELLKRIGFLKPFEKLYKDVMNQNKMLRERMEHLKAMQDTKD